MEEFKKIDWNNKIEDIIDNKFVDEERMQNESAMYKIVNGIFKDPFADLKPPEFPNKQKQDSEKSTPVKEANLKKNIKKRIRTKSKQQKTING